MELMKHSATELAAMIREREVSPVEVVDAALDTIEKRNPALNAVVFVAEEESRASAREAEAAVMRGDDLGPLHGVPTALKDLFDFKPGWPTTFGGVPAFKDHTFESTCAWCANVEAAGAIVVAKTNSALLGASGITDNPLFGATRNPFDLARNSGGSSGGSGAAVADGILPFAEATDMGGSARLPAAWCNAVGFKQTWGFTSYVSRPNAFIGTSALPAEGVIARTLDDIALVLGAIIAPNPRDPQNVGVLARYVDEPEASLRGVRIAFSPDLDVFFVEPEVAAVVAEAVKALEDAGAIVEQVKVGFTREQGELTSAMGKLGAMGSLDSLEFFKSMGVDLLRDYRHDLTDSFIEGAEAAAELKFSDVSAAQRVRTEVFDAIENTFATYDLIVTPTIGSVAALNATEVEGRNGAMFAGEKQDRSLGASLTFPFNMSGHPAASVPAGLTPEGLPVGLQIIGRRFRDAEVVTAGRALEAIRPWAQYYDRVVSMA